MTSPLPLIMQGWGGWQLCFWKTVANGWETGLKVCLCVCVCVCVWLLIRFTV